MTLPLSENSELLVDQNDIVIAKMRTDRLWESDRDYIVHAVNAYDKDQEVIGELVGSVKNYHNALAFHELGSHCCKVGDIINRAEGR